MGMSLERSCESKGFIEQKVKNICPFEKTFRRIFRLVPRSKIAQGERDFWERHLTTLSLGVLQFKATDKVGGRLLYFCWF